MAIKNLHQYVIVSDFDGTITQEDSNDLLLTTLGTEKNIKIEEDYISGLIGNKEAMDLHFEEMVISMEEYINFIKENITIDPYFDNFLAHIKAQGIPFFIVSAGFKQGIQCVLGPHRLKGVQVFANELKGNPLKPWAAHKDLICKKGFGPCTICKKIIIDEIREATNKKIIYIGDGLTDRCADADILFAKNALAQYCDTQGLSYHPFQTFNEINI